MTQIQIEQSKRPLLLSNSYNEPIILVVTLFNALYRPVKVRVQLSEDDIVLMPSCDGATINPVTLSIKRGKLVVSASSLEDGVAYRQEEIEIIDIPEDEIPF